MRKFSRMKRIPFLVCFFFIGFLITKAKTTEKSYCSSTVLSANAVPVIIGVPNMSSKTFAAVKTNLMTISGVTLNAYCPTQKCFFLSVDRSIQPDNSAIITAITNAYAGLKVYVKTGSTADVESHCSGIIYYQQGTNPASPNKN